MGFKPNKKQTDEFLFENGGTFERSYLRKRPKFYEITNFWELNGEKYSAIHNFDLTEDGLKAASDFQYETTLKYGNRTIKRKESEIIRQQVVGLFYKGYSSQKIAQELNCHIGTVHSVIRNQKKVILPKLTPEQQLDALNQRLIIAEDKINKIEKRLNQQKHRRNTQNESNQTND